MNKLFNKVQVIDVIDVLLSNNLTVYRNDVRRFNLNIVNIRAYSQQAGKFDDVQVVFWFEGGKVKYRKFAVTVDPGVPYLLKPINKKGTAIVLPGQYVGVWELGLHRGKYDALVQVKPIKVIRDNDKNSILKYATLETLKNSDLNIDEGYFGINCHRASKYGISETVGLYSAGCCVHADPYQYNLFMDICKAASENWGNSFTATWITEYDLDNSIIN